MEVKKIVEGMTAVEVAEVIDSNFKNQNKILEEDIAKQNNVIGVSEYKDFSEAEAVNVGDVRKYEGFLYECVEATTGAFDASKWKKSSFKAETEKKLSELGSEIKVFTLNEGTNYYPLKSGNIYIITNTSNTDVNLYCRVSEESENISIKTPLKSGEIIEYEAVQDTYYVRIGGSGYVSIRNKRSIIEKINALEKNISDIECLYLKPLELSLSQAGGTAYPFRVGKTYRLTSLYQTNDVTVSTKQSGYGDIVETIGILRSGKVIEFTPTADADYLRCGGAVTLRVEIIGDSTLYGLSKKISEIEYGYLSHLEHTFIQPGSIAYPFKAGKTYRIISISQDGDATISTRLTENGDTVDMIGTLRSGNIIEFSPSVDANYLRCGRGSVTLMVEYLHGTSTPMVEIAYDTMLKDVSTYVEQFDDLKESDNGLWRTIPNQIYSAFDSLVALYPNYVSKIDIAKELGIEYPSYTRLGGQSSSEYLATPSYNMYMYKFSSIEPSVNTTQQKKKALIISGVHGNEVAAPVNLYTFMRMMCEAIDENYFKLRGAFDFYVIPIVNGYGMYHFNKGGVIKDGRCNPNGVNINRNYPIEKWELSDNGGINYTGPSAGSEFETKVVIGATNLIKPDIAIDHHNYGSESTFQYYCELTKVEHLPLSYQSYMDCNIAFTKGLPYYFGNSYLQIAASGLGGVLSPLNTSAARWWHEQGIYVSATIEVSNVIKYLNGVISSGSDNYGNNTYSIAEYTLRNIMFRFANKALKK